jgi:RNA recognition motif-containing protein
MLLLFLYNSFNRFESIEDAEYAQKKLNRTRLGDKMLHVDFAQGDRKSKLADEI